MMAQTNGRPQVAVDTLIRSLAVVAGSAWIGRPLNQTDDEFHDFWKNGGEGGRLSTVKFEVDGFNNENIELERGSIAAIAEHVISGKCQLAETKLMQYERITQPPLRYRAAFAGIDLLNDCSFDLLTSPIDARIEELTVLSTLGGRKNSPLSKTLLKGLIANINTPEFESLRLLAQGKDQDSLNIYIAHMNRCDYFMTMDTRLLSHFDEEGRSKKLNWLHTLVGRPSMIAARLRLKQLNLYQVIRDLTTWSYEPGIMKRPRSKWSRLQ